MSASVRWAVKDGRLWVSTPYRIVFVNDLKDRIPWQHREWDRDRKVWKVDLRYQDTVGALILQHFDVDLDEPENRDKPGFSTPNEGMAPPPPRTGTKTPRELQLERELAKARSEIIKLDAIIRSLNVDKLRMMGMQQTSGPDLLDKIFRSPQGDKAWKKLSLAVHPDMGGDTELFKEMEALWARVKK